MIEVDTNGKLNIYNSTMIEYTTFELFSMEEEALVTSFLIISVILIVVIILIILFYQYSRKKRQIMTTTIDSLIGKEGIVVKTVKPNNFHGNVRVKSEVWSATANETISKNQKIKVVDTQGIKIIVEKLKIK